MDRIKTVKVSSRRSAQIHNQYFTVEMSLDADVTGLDDDAKKEYIEKMWNYANDEVDNQLLNAK